MIINIIIIVGVVLLGLILNKLSEIMAKLEDQDPSGNMLLKIQLLLEKIELSTTFDGAKEARYEYHNSGRLKTRVINFIGRPSIVEELDNPDKFPLKKFQGFQDDYYDSGNIKQRSLYLDGYPVKIDKFDESGDKISTQDYREGSVMVCK